MPSTKLTLVTVGLAALLLVAGTAGAIPSQGADHAPNADSESESQEPTETEDGEPSTGVASNATDRPQRNHDGHRAGPPADGWPGADRSATRGPPTSLPDQVPTHVTRIHETIRSFLAGSLDRPLGHALSNLLSGDTARSPSQRP